MFALSVFLTFFVGRISFREGLPSNVTSRLYVFGTKGSALDSLIWIFLLVGTLAIGTVQLGNAIIYYFGWTDEVTKHLLYLGISAAWVLMSLFGMKFIARFNMVFVGLLFVALLFVAGSIAQEGHLADALTHGVLVPHVGQMEGFAYAVNYSIMTSGLMALFSSDFTRFVKKERDLAAISVVGSVFAVLTYVFGALLAYYGFDVSYQYFLAQGYDEVGAANAAITNPGITFVLSLGLVGMVIICLSQLKVETSNSISSSNAMSNLFDSLFGVKLKLPVAVVAVNLIGVVFIFGNILDQVNSFMGIGSILTMFVVLPAHHRLLPRARAAAHRLARHRVAQVHRRGQLARRRHHRAGDAGCWLAVPEWPFARAVLAGGSHDRGRVPGLEPAASGSA